MLNQSTERGEQESYLRRNLLRNIAAAPVLVDLFYSEITMKKKPTAEPIISPEILEMARKSVEVERATPSKPCVVCGAPCIPLTGPQVADDENLCWVCRRLKISAWRDADQQMSAQE